MKAFAAKVVRSALLLPVVLAVLVVALIGTVLVRWAPWEPSHRAVPGQKAPENLTVESQLGIRFSHVAVVGGGGLVELTYTVLDPEKATTFQSDTTHPPTILRTGDSDNPVHIAALMKQGHNLRPGQTYFILYENPKGIVQSGDTVEIRSKAGTLANFPVE